MMLKSEETFSMKTTAPALYEYTTSNNFKAGYKIQYQQINHLAYIDDLELSAKNDIGMKFGIKKLKEENVRIDEEVTVKELEPGKACRYLGIHRNIHAR